MVIKEKKGYNNGMVKRKISLFKITIFIIIVFFLAASVTAGLFFYGVIAPNNLPASDPALTTRFYDANGELLTTLYRENRIEVPLEEIPQELRQAIIAVEDAHFYQHFGINLASLGRAALRNIRSGRIVEGGSTITQQLAKNLFLTHDRTFHRKVEELILTFQLEHHYTKDEILNKYLNTIYFGHGAYGVEAAAQTYFDQPASQLSLAQSALLAGLPRGPGYYSPLLEGNQEAAKRRQAHVLNRMVEMGFITPEEKEKALAQELVFREEWDKTLPAGHFIDYIMERELVGKLNFEREDIYRGGLNIYTTLDPSLQEAGERVLEEGLESFPQVYQDSQEVRQPQGALVALDPQTGHVKALVGGRSYQETKLNRAISRRSPGSAFKPFLYAAALDAGYTAASFIKCEPISIDLPGSQEPYEPRDFGGGFHHRQLTLREALVQSCNVSAVRVNMDLGAPKLVEYAEKMGINSPLNPVPSLALGTSEVTPLEMAAAYAPLANGGFKVEPVFVTKITDSRNLTLWEQENTRERVLSELTAFILTDILQEVLGPGGTGWRASELIDFPAAGKTGTSSDHRDVYMVGYTPDLVTSIYLGDDHQKSLGNSTGGSLALPLWAEFMTFALEGRQPRDFPWPPEEIVTLTLCGETGLLQNNRCQGPSLEEIFIQGTEPQETCCEKTCPHVEKERPWWPFELPQLPWFR
ncbi:MAG: penicillin-binding protein 1A [Candidatus Syntrophonatronum acetioxidans]|uniref:Penicillin-binding protein 1A n=1 Tax=Candidatus Syntrophonatronum acetioxidans TaxID=1795816 RepID=A0A424YFT7_9FIRM|nr:MAG: penicillin-binding protein 1A [Candidatus Syntrophonatronum acetioxidans]